MSAEPELDRLDRAVEFYDRCKGPSYGDAVNGVIGGARAVLARFGRRGPDGRSAPPSTDTEGDPNRWTADKFRLALEAIDALRPEDFRTGQSHLPPAFREVNFQDAFREVCRIVNGALHGTDENGSPL